MFLGGYRERRLESITVKKESEVSGTSGERNGNQKYNGKIVFLGLKGWWIPKCRWESMNHLWP